MSEFHDRIYFYLGRHVSIFQQVVKILEPIPHCATLNLQGNPLASFTDDATKRFNNLKKLVLNQTNITWDSLAIVLRHFPWYINSSLKYALFLAQYL